MEYIRNNSTAPEPSFITEPSTTTSQPPARQPILSPSQSCPTSSAPPSLAQDSQSSEPKTTTSNGHSEKAADVIQNYLSATLTTDDSLDGSADTVQRLAYEQLLDRRSDWMLNSDALEIKNTYIILVLFYATNGNDWTKTPGWFSSSNHPVCGNDHVPPWFGVNCNDERSITKLLLEENNLVGILPSELQGLTSLTNLTFSKNKIYGTIPLTFGKLTNLGM